MKYVIVGNGAYALMLKKYLYNTKRINVEGFTVPSQFINEPYLDNIPVIGAEDVEKYFPLDEYKLFMGIGYSKMNTIKAQEFMRYDHLGYRFANYVHPTAIIEDDVEIGDGNNIFEGVIIQSGVKIGDGNLIYAGAMVAHETTIGNYNSLSVKSCVAGCVNVGNNCFLGANSTVRDHIVVSDYTLLGAGTYLSKNSMPYDVIVSPKSTTLCGRKSTEFI